ncbi:MAG: helix-turn-helix transcriptional regulator, partial [Lachnospiraceae bacterium]|nr:helix-turn-helix transcriptional regulator [Lachnospiraceae bacterium]
FKEQCGTSVVSYIQQVRITRAKNLLRFSEDPIEKIAEECGIPDANYFARVFKKVEGIAPGEYRKLWKGRQRFDQ